MLLQIRRESVNPSGLSRQTGQNAVAFRVRFSVAETLSRRRAQARLRRLEARLYRPIVFVWLSLVLWILLMFHGQCIPMLLLAKMLALNPDACRALQ
jgi:hypothetical protein